MNKQIKKISGEYFAQQDIRAGELVDVIDTDFFAVNIPKPITSLEFLTIEYNSGEINQSNIKK